MVPIISAKYAHSFSLHLFVNNVASVNFIRALTLEPRKSQWGYRLHDTLPSNQNRIQFEMETSEEVEDNHSLIQ